MEHSRARHSCAVYENYIYVLGGTDANGGSRAVGYRGERLDLSSLTWENLPTLPHKFYHGQAFFFQSSLYLVHMEEGTSEAVMVKLNKDNEWQVTYLGPELDFTVFPAPILSPDILGC